jgi:tetratricopeptide (TPR) repeat protein
MYGASVSCTLRHDPLQRGQQLFKQGDYQRAVLEYRTALQRQPDSPEAMYRLAVALQRVDKPREAYDLLMRATRKLADDHDANLELAKLSVSMYMVNPKRPQAWADQVIKVADRLLAKQPRSFDGLRLKGLLAVADGRTDDAVNYLERANRVRTGEADVVTVLVQSLIVSGRKDEAERLGQDLMQKNPHYAPIYDTMYALYNGGGRRQDAEKVLLSKVEKNRTNHLFTIQLARHYWRTGQAERMNQVLDQLRTTHERGRLVAGDFLAEIGRRAEALQTYKEGASIDTADRALYEKRQVKVHLATGRPSEALAILEQILTRDSNDQDARAYRAHAWITSGHADQLNSAIAELEILVKAQPESVDYAYSLADAYRRREDLGRAEELLARILKQQPDHLLALQSMAELNIKLREFAKANHYAEQLLRLSPRNVSARLIETATLAAFGQPAQARKNLELLLRQQPGLAEAWLQMVMLDIAEKRYADAERILRQFDAAGRGDVRLLRHWVEFYGAQGRWAQALQLVRQESKGEAASLALRPVLAQTAARAGEYALAIETYRALAADQPKNADHLERLGALHIDSGALNQAVEALERAHALRPSDPVILARLGSALQLSGRAADAEKHLRRSLELNSDPVVMNNLAHLLAAAGIELDEALLLAQKAVERLPGNRTVEDTLGYVYLRRGMVGSARKIFERLVQQEPANQTFHQHLLLARN